MKRILILAIWLSSVTVAHAQSDDRTAKSSPHNVYVLGGFNYGGFAFGAAYEHMYDNSAGIGGHLRMFSKDDDRFADGYMIVGAHVAHHFYKKSWDLAFTPSFNIINIDSARPAPNDDDATTFGPGLSISLLCQMTDSFAIGFDNSRYWVWFDDDYQGRVVDDFAIKARFAF